VLKRIEIVGGVVAVALLCMLAGYALVSGVLLARPDSEVAACVARAEDASNTKRPPSALTLTEACTQLVHGGH
jgi:hypothetical protein